MVEPSTIAIFLSGGLAGGIIVYLLMKVWMEQRMEEWKEETGKEIKRKTLEHSRNVLKGKVGEQFAPFIKGFDHQPSDCRFIGDPIDYIIFDGMSEGEIEKVVLADVKTGPKSHLNSRQEEIKELVEKGEVNWKTLKVKTQ